MKRILGVFSIFVAIAVTGCDAVYTPQPLGDEIVKLDPATWQGTWLSGEAVVLTTVMDGDKGQLQAAWMERGAAGAMFETVTGTVRRTGDTMFLSMEHEPFIVAAAGREENAGDQTEYYWARIANDGRRAIMWWPDVEQVRLAGKDGRLPGVIKKDKDVILKQPGTVQLQLINSPASRLMNWSQPVTLIRIGD